MFVEKKSSSGLNSEPFYMDPNEFCFNTEYGFSNIAQLRTVIYEQSHDVLMKLRTSHTVVKAPSQQAC